MLDDQSAKTTKIGPENTPSPASGALTIAPRDLRIAAPQNSASANSETPVRREPTMNALAVDEEDAERVAFSMWREGRTDDAIAFLEREILLEKDRVWKRDVLSERVEPHFGEPAPKVIVTPPPAPEAKPKRRRRKRSQDTAPVSEPVFSDASSAAPLIELAAETVIVAPKETPTFPRMGRGPAIIAALGLIIIGIAYAANLWNDRQAAPVEIAAPAIAIPPAEVTTPQDEPQQTASVTSAAMELDPLPAAEIDPVAASAPEAATIPAPDATVEEPAAALDPDEMVTEPGEDAALAEPEGFDNSATPPDELDGMMFGPEAPVAVARLPRQRPEPPADVVYALPPQQTATRPAAVSPLPYDDEQRAVDGLPQPFYGYDGLPQRDTLTPAEYRALLERRAIAEDYVSQRRAIAEQSAPPERRVILRLLRR